MTTVEHYTVLAGHGIPTTPLPNGKTLVGPILAHASHTGTTLTRPLTLASLRKKKLAGGWSQPTVWTTFDKVYEAQIENTTNPHIATNHQTFEARLFVTDRDDLPAFQSLFFVNDAVVWGTDERGVNVVYVDALTQNPRYVVSVSDPMRPPPGLAGARPVPIDPQFVKNNFETTPYQGATDADRRFIQRYTPEYERFARRRFWVRPTLKDGRFAVDLVVNERPPAPCPVSLGSVDGDMASFVPVLPTVVACDADRLALASVEEKVFLNPYLAPYRTFISDSEVTDHLDGFRRGGR
jgi:hypothetical protein